MTRVSWQIPPDGEFELRRFGEEALLFDGRDGRTHYLSPVAALIVQALGDEWRTTDSVIQEVETHLDIEFDGAERQHVELAVRQLASLGIVNRKCASTS